MIQKTETKIYAMAKTALLTAVLCLSSYFAIPVPFAVSVLSLQTVAVNLLSLMLKPRHSFMCVLSYILLGAVGLPVFSGGTSGIGKLTGPTGGFYFGFLVSAIVISILKDKRKGFRYYVAVTIFAGIPIQHIFGILFMCFHNGFNVSSAVMSVSLPFIPFDIIKCIVACLLYIEIEKKLKTVLTD